MKAAMWRSAVTRFAIPQLPGDWAATGQLLIRRPVGWLLQGVCKNSSGFSTDFRAVAFVQLLAVPRAHVVLSCGHELANGRAWPTPLTVAECEPVMRQIAAAVESEALPHFARYGTLDGYLSWLHERVARLDEQFDGRGWQDATIGEQLVYLHLLRGETELALRTAELTARAADLDGRSFAVELNARVQRVAEAARASLKPATQVLREYLDFSRTALKLPEPQRSELL